MENATFTAAPSDITSNTTYGKDYASVTWTIPIVVDNSGIYTLTSNFDPGDNFTIGETVVNYQAIDLSGNVAVHSFTITIQGRCMRFFLFAS